jgi:hypothetical protein
VAPTIPNRKQFKDDPEMLWAVIAFLLDLWKKTLELRDSAFQVAQQIDGWEKQFQEALQDPLRRQCSETQVAPLQQLFDALYDGQLTDSLLAQILAELKRQAN